MNTIGDITAFTVSHHVITGPRHLWSASLDCCANKAPVGSCPISRDDTRLQTLARFYSIQKEILHRLSSI